MNETLTVRRWYRAVPAGACLVVCALLGFVQWLCLAAPGALGNLFLLAISIAYAVVVGSLVVHLLFCWGHRLQFENGRIIGRGVFAATEIRLADVTDVKWLPHGLGGVVLKTNFDKVTINFARYPPDASVRIIQFLHEFLAKSMQRDWDRFCLRVAIPLRNPGSETRRTQVVFSRAQFDRLLSAVFFADLAFAVGYWRIVGFPGDWTITALPLALTGLFWGSVRYLVSVRYVAKVRWFPLASFIDLVVDHLAWGFCFLGLILLCCAFLFGIPRGLGIATAVVVIAGLFELVRRLIKYRTEYKQERDHDLAHSEAAVHEWELLDRMDAAAAAGAGVG
jgi:hypothetical protein